MWRRRPQRQQGRWRQRRDLFVVEREFEQRLELARQFRWQLGEQFWRKLGLEQR
jgi:hypothetical protein